MKNINKKVAISLPILIVIIIAVIVTLQMQKPNNTDNDPNLNPPSTAESTNEKPNEDIKMGKIYLTANGHKMEVALEDNESTKELIMKLGAGDISVETKDYGGFEKVGDLGFTLPTNDMQLTTQPGDLILYQGNQLTLHYGSNVWSYTKLGHIDMAEDELKEILGDGDVTLVLSAR